MKEYLFSFPCIWYSDIMLRRTLLVLVTGLVALAFGRDTEGSVTNRLVEIRKAVDRMKHHRGEKIDI